MSTYIINGTMIDLAALKAAKWRSSRREARVSIEPDDDGRLVATDAASDGEGGWEALTAEHVTGVDGADYSVCIVDTDCGPGADVCLAASGTAAADCNSPCEIVEIDDDGDEWGRSVTELARDLGLDLDWTNCLPGADDYRAAADDYVAEHPGARYFLDFGRGYANEWDLHVILDGDAEIGDDWDDVADYAASYLADAVMDAETFRGECAAGKCCGAVEH